jgi:type III restriction enzyme
VPAHPTGGSKTLLAAHAVGRMHHGWPTRHPQPLALWLVPSETIRSQTLAALTTPGHPFRNALAQACGEDVRVCSLENLATLSPQDFDAHAVVVATIQSFRVEDTEQRNVYAFSEAFEPHFRDVPPAALLALRDSPDALVTQADADSARAGREMLARFVGQPRWSLANWLALRQPYVIVDEAHNVSAQQLQAEDMIKMPIAGSGLPGRRCVKVAHPARHLRVSDQRHCAAPFFRAIFQVGQPFQHHLREG